MATLTQHQPGDFCWVELGTPDQKAAKVFYETVLGWTGEDSPIGPESFYTTFRLGARPVAGGYQTGSDAMSNAPPHWMIYYQTADCAASTEKAIKAGARPLAQVMSLAGVGTFSILADPQGAVFALYEPLHAA